MAIVYMKGEAGKICSRCNLWQSLVNFSKRPTGDGYQSHCKACRAVHGRNTRTTFPERHKQAKRKYRMNNAENISLYRRQHYRANRSTALRYASEYRRNHLERVKTREKKYYGERRPYILARRKSYYQVHADELRRYSREYGQLYKARIRARERKYRLKHPETALAWRAANRDKLKAMKQRRRARKRNAGASFTAAEWAELKRLYDYTCLCCLRREPEIRLVSDHIIPLGPQGTGLIENIQPLCDSCNKRKATKSTDYRQVWKQNNQ